MKNQLFELQIQSRTKIININMIISVIVFIADIISIIAYHCINNSLNIKNLLQHDIRLLLPSITNFIIILIINNINKNPAIKIRRKNISLIYLSFLICTIIAITHDELLISKTILIIPVIDSLLLDDLRCTKKAYYLSFISLLISTSILSINDDMEMFKTKVLSTVTFVPIITITYIICENICIMNNNKNTILLNNIKEKTTIQQKLKIDKMTNLYNHDTFYDHLKKFLNKPDPISLVVLDVDHFKNINDTYGHRNGDKALIAIAKILKLYGMKVGEAFRYGGEEFAIIITNNNVDAFDIVEEIRKEIYNIKYDFTDQPISISAGIYENIDKTLSIEDIFTKADDALYCAKKSGRNQCSKYK